MPGMVSIFLGAVVVAGAVVAVVPAVGETLVVAAWSEPPPSLHAIASSAIPVTRTTIRRAHERSRLSRRRRHRGADGWRRDKPSTLGGASDRIRAPGRG